MKNNRLPNKEEWDKIVDEAFSSGEVHKFSEHYRMKKKSILKGVIIMKKHNTLMNLTVAVSAFAVIAFPTGIYLATRTAETEPATQAPAEEISDNSEKSAVNNETIYALQIGWLPEGFEQLEENEEGICYGKKDGEAEITVLFLKNTKYTLLSITQDADIVDTAETWFSDGKSYVINYNDSYDEESADPNVRGRRAMVAFDGTDYLVRIIVTDSISKDDLNKIIREMKLVPSDTETAKDYSPSNLTNVEISDGNDDGEVNENVYLYTEDDKVEEEQIYKVEYGWLPEGMEYHTSGPYSDKMHNDITGGGITPAFVKNVSGEDIETEREFTVLDEYQTDGKTVKITYRDDYNEEIASPDNYGRIAIIYFDNTPYVLSLWVTDEISKDDLKKIIENVTLVPTKFEIASIYPPEETEEDPQSYSSAVNADDCTIYKIGDEISEPNPDKKGNISVKVNSVRFQDNLDGLEINRHRLEVDPNKYLDENGKIINRQMNMVNENFEVVGSIQIPCHVMVVNLTYTNHDDETIDYMVAPPINHKYDDGTFDNETPMWTNVYDNLCYDFDYNDLFDDYTYFSESGDKFGEFDDVVLAPNESAEIQLAFLVRDDMRDNMYLNINGYCNENSTNLVDLSNLE